MMGIHRSHQMGLSSVEDVSDGAVGTERVFRATEGDGGATSLPVSSAELRSAQSARIHLRTTWPTR